MVDIAKPSEPLCFLNSQEISIAAYDGLSLPKTQAFDAIANLLDHFQIGLAAFAQDMTLLLCNQTFYQSFDCGPSWLIKIHTFHDFMEDFRLRRFLPEVMDFLAYKAVLQNCFVNKTIYEEYVHLVDERTFKVCLMPYQATAMFLLFKEETQDLMLKRKYNSVLQKHDNFKALLQEGVAIFHMGYRLGYMNPAMLSFFSLSHGIRDLEEFWSTIMPFFLEPHAVQEQLLHLLQEKITRSWFVPLTCGQGVLIRYTHLSDGETMFFFSQAPVFLYEKLKKTTILDHKDESFLLSIE